MFSLLLRHTLWTLSNVYEVSNKPLFYLFLLIVLLTIYLSWRLWRFVLVPSLDPREPKQSPYIFPSHAIRFFRNYDGVFTCNGGGSQASKNIFKLTFPGQELYVMTSPRDIAQVYKNTAELTFDTFIRQTLKSLGASSSAIEKWIPQRHYQAESDQTVTGSILPASDFTHIGEKLCQRQLLPGRELDSLQRVFMNGIHEALLWDKVTPKCTLRSCPRLKTVSLLSWCREVLLESATHAFFGERLMRINPNLFASFFIFDASSWKLNYGYPRFLSNELYAARDVIIDSLESYFKLPRSKRPGMSYLITQFEDEMKRLDIEERDIAALVMPVYWVINANAYKQCFWMMAFILFSPGLCIKLRNEVSPVVIGDTKDLELRLEQQCPHLKAVYLEVLRLSSSSSTLRGILHATDIGDKTLKTGANILIPYRRLHLNPEIFGENAEHFDPERFLRDPNLAKNPCFRPFGGGKTYCPGRYLAEREVLTFVALAIYRFDIGVAKIDPVAKSMDENCFPMFPRMDKQKFCLGIMEPVKGDDLLIDIAPRGY